ncbi:vacuolar-sorting receptor 2-like [Bidens hawaiensis]|uniref:vacuolar-sorting receptor 2-like n=1 Tax=Bidens hawaiensis TaxID=980011 RepID=UPI00404A76A2
MTMGKLRFIISVWFLFMCGSCLCSFVVENNSLKVSSPENLKGTYECAVSSFGVPQHGGTLTGVVVYLKVNQKACNSFTHEISFKTKAHVGSLPVFLLADRGDCHFSFKVQNAQNAGAAGILVANDREFLTTIVDGYIMENQTIPLALIRRSLGNSIKKALYEGEFVRMNLEWTGDFTHHELEQVDMDKSDTNECPVDECIDLTQEDEWDVHPFWGVLMMNNISSWLKLLWENRII